MHAILSRAGGATGLMGGIFLALCSVIVSAQAITLQIPTRPTEFPLVAEPYQSTGNVIAWGGGSDGDLQTNIDSTISNVVQVAAGYYHTAALKADGTVVVWSSVNYGQTSIPAGLTNVVEVAAGERHVIALKSNGTVLAWGDNQYGQTNVPVGLTNVVQIAAGGYYSLAVKSDGTVVPWGQLSWPAWPNKINITYTNAVQVDTKGISSLALMSDGTVRQWGYSGYNLTNIPPGLTNVVQIAAGYYHAAALKSDGTVVAWGYNENGETNVPANLTNVVQIAAGLYHTVALKNDGTVVTWGANIGDSNNTTSLLTNALQVAANGYHTVAIAVISNQIISQFDTINDHTYGDAPFSITPPTASSGLPVVVSVKSGPVTISSNVITITGSGSVVLEANQGGHPNYFPAKKVSASFFVAPANQTINSFPLINDHTYGDAPFSITPPTASSGLPVVVSVKSGPATISSNVITITGTGIVNLKANQNGNMNYRSAPEITTFFNVNKATQTLIPIDLPNSFGFGSGSLTLVPTNQLGLPLIYNIISGPAALSSNVLTFTGIGTVALSTTQAGNQNYNPNSITNTYIIKNIQTINPFTPVPTKTFGTKPFGIVRPTSSSGLPVSLSILSGPATISGTNVAISGAGTVVLAANQLGNSNYAVAPQITTSFTVNKANQTISLKGVILPTKTGSYTIPNIKSSAGLPVTFGCTYGDVSQTGPDQITINSAGAVTITADQPGNANYNPAPQVRKGFMVAKSPQTISLSRVSIPTVPGTYDIPLIYSSAGLPVELRFISGPVADAGGGRYTIYALGTVVVRATQSGNGAYLPAPPARVSFRIK